jgi:hypothetical protein
MLNELQLCGLIKKQFKVVKKSRQLKQVDRFICLLLRQSNKIYLYENIT